MSRDIVAEYAPLFNPRSVALLGASGKPGKVGRMWMERFVEAGFENRYPVNLRENKIMGIKAYPSCHKINVSDISRVNINNLTSSTRERTN